MNLEKFYSRLQIQYIDLHWPKPKSTVLKRITQKYTGMANLPTLSLLNFAVSCMPRTELYLEIGSFYGRSLIAALIIHTDKQGIGIENFSQFEIDINTTKENISHYKNISLIQGDYIDILKRKNKKIDKPIGVYFYDGNHSAFDHLLHFLVIERYLSNQALIIIDDTSAPWVAQITHFFLSLNSRFKLQHVLDDDLNYWYKGKQYKTEKKWNGLFILSYHRQNISHYFKKKCLILFILTILAIKDRQLKRLYIYLWNTLIN